MAPERKRSRPSLADVAKHAGVSVTTASFVLNERDDMRVSTPTADRVREAARILEYGRRVRGRNLARPLSLIGFVSDTIASDHFTGEMIRGALGAAAERGYGVVIAESTGARSLERSVVADLIARGVERFLYAAMSTQTTQVPAELADHLVVLLNCVSPERTRQAVVPDDRAAGALAAGTLLDAGHRDRIWLVGEEGESYAGKERYRGIAALLASRGLALSAHLPCRWWPPEARQAVSARLAAGADRPTAMIAMNDRVAMGIYQAAAAAGLSIPQDLSVISFDNSELAWWLSPGLTSIGLPYFEMGQRAVEALLGESGDDPLAPIPMPLHVRESIRTVSVLGVD